jgi:hypothetical protein
MASGAPRLPRRSHDGAAKRMKSPMQALREE